MNTSTTRSFSWVIVIAYFLLFANATDIFARAGGGGGGSSSHSSSSHSRSSTSHGSGGGATIDFGPVGNSIVAYVIIIVVFSIIGFIIWGFLFT